MANLSLANQILAGQSMDPRPIQANFTDIVTFINDEVFTVDGTKALTSALTLAGPGVADGHAVQKSQLDAAVTKAEDELSVGLISAESDATTKADAAEAAAVVTANAYTDTKAIETDFATDVTAGSLETTGTAALFLDTGNITNTKAGHYIITVTLDVAVHTVAAGPALNAFIGELHVKNVMQLNQMVWHPLPATVGTRVTLSSTWIVTAGAGNTLDFQVKVLQAAGGQGSYMCDGSSHSFISALFVG